MKKYAVVTDAVSSGFIFPVWYRYYARMFGGDNIFVLTYGDKVGQFSTYELGGVESIATNYSDDVRKDKISNLVESLLDIYDVVIRVDSDEFLVPEDTKYKSLKSYLDDWKGQYITAKGFDVCEIRGDKKLNLNGKILANRYHCYPLMAMNKTVITRTPIKWGRGFHYCNREPKIGGVILFHTKRLSVDLQLEWNEYMVNSSGSDAFVNDYYTIAKENIEKYHEWRGSQKVYKTLSGNETKEFISHYLDGISYNPSSDFYEGKYDMAEYILEIPKQYRKYF